MVQVIQNKSVPIWIQILDAAENLMSYAIAVGHHWQPDDFIRSIFFKKKL